MRYRYYFAQLYNEQLKKFLDNNGIKYKFTEKTEFTSASLVFEISSTTQNAEKYLAELKNITFGSPHVSVEFTPSECAKAELLMMRPRSQSIDIVNSAEAYTYACKWTNRFGVKKVKHQKQVGTFKIAKEPSMKTKTAFWCNSPGFAEIFTDYRVRDLVTKNELKGIEFKNVVQKKGNLSEKLFQLSSDNVLRKECIGRGFGEKIITCPQCGREQYAIEDSYQLHLDFSKIKETSDLYMTERMFGYGFAEPLYLISQRFYQLLKEANLAGGVMFAPVVDISKK